MLPYQEFLQSKIVAASPSGFEVALSELNPKLFDWQKRLVQWALRLGKAALFCNCGMGKTLMQLEWAKQIHRYTGQRVLILAPLAVAHQTVREAEKFGIQACYAPHQQEYSAPIVVTNYERVEKFNLTEFGAVVLDESSVLKHRDSKSRDLLINLFAKTPYKLCCTATPSPNDHMELGNHAEFLGIMSQTEMLAEFFVHDGGETQKWRLKGHAESKFWEWVSSWAVMIRKPSDLGYSDQGYELPPLEMHDHIVDRLLQPLEGELFILEGRSLQERRRARRESLQERVEIAANLANASTESWLLWCDLNDESAALTKAIDGAVEVKGSDSSEHKEQALIDFAEGRIRVLVSKPSICGFGLNFQSCHNVVFVGLSDSYEAFYQAIRRCWRFGQTQPVQCHLVYARSEGAVIRNIERKHQEAERMAAALAKQINLSNLCKTMSQKNDYQTEVASGEGWELRLGDCVEVFSDRPDSSLDYGITSVPFASLYTYSNSERDMGNCRNYEEFNQHFLFLVKEIYRSLKPGRLISIHCMNLPTSKQNDGYIGIRDFRGHIIQDFIATGFIYHSEVCIWKDPVTAMQRTKALGLLYKQLKKDSAMSRQGIPDYLVSFRKPGDNPDPVTKHPEDFPVDLWQNYASPVWMDINPSDTLQRTSAREEKDERHICPLQLEVICRAIRLWTNPGDLVFDPFTGIGSSGVVALQMKRRFFGSELKCSYFDQAVVNLQLAAGDTHKQISLLEALA